MKPFLRALEKGKKISVEVIEVQTAGDLLVSYHGELFRVKNTSGHRFEIGEKVLLICTSKNPLEFSLDGDSSNYSRWV